MLVDVLPNTFNVSSVRVFQTGAAERKDNISTRHLPPRLLHLCHSDGGILSANIQLTLPRPSCFNRFPFGHVALWEPAGSGPSHLQPGPQQELQAAGVDGSAQQWDQTHQQLHASGRMTPAAKRWSVVKHLMKWCVCVCGQKSVFLPAVGAVVFWCLQVLCLHTGVCSLCALWSVASTTVLLKERVKEGGQEGDGGVMRLMSNSPSWTDARVLAELK